jgi:hypothetical protein
VRKV